MILGNLGQFTKGPVLTTLHININTSFMSEWKQRWYPRSAASGTGTELKWLRTDGSRCGT